MATTVRVGPLFGTKAFGARWRIPWKALKGKLLSATRLQAARQVTLVRMKKQELAVYKRNR